MASEEHTEWPLPFVPAHHWGVVLEREGSEFVLWISDLCVEAASPGSASEQDVDSLRRLAMSLRSAEAAPNAARLLEQLESMGYRELAERRYDFQSGALYQYARVLAVLALRTGQRRKRLLDARQGRHPSLAHPDWPEWEDAVMTMNATVMGGWILGVAAVEALVNEILSQRFPDDYEEMELRRRGGFAAKLWRLCDRLALDPNGEWVSRIVEAHSSRSDLVHHKPAYLEDRRDRNSVEPSAMHDPQAITEFLSWVDTAFEQLFGAFGLGVPPTHRHGVDGVMRRPDLAP